jgi:hypothetical protein
VWNIRVWRIWQINHHISSLSVYYEMLVTIQKQFYAKKQSWFCTIIVILFLVMLNTSPEDWVNLCFWLSKLGIKYRNIWTRGAM